MPSLTDIREAHEHSNMDTVRTPYGKRLMCHECMAPIAEKEADGEWLWI